MIALTVFLGVVLRVTGSGGIVTRVRAAGVGGVLGGLCLVFAYAAGILTMQKATIASAVLLFVTVPIYAAVLGYFLLGEHVRKSTWSAIAIAMAGILVMRGGAFSPAQILEYPCSSSEFF